MDLLLVYCLPELRVNSGSLPVRAFLPPPRGDIVASGPLVTACHEQAEGGFLRLPFNPLCPPLLGTVVGWIKSASASRIHHNLHHPIHGGYFNPLCPPVLGDKKNAEGRSPSARPGGWHGRSEACPWCVDIKECGTLQTRAGSCCTC